MITCHVLESNGRLEGIRKQLEEATARAGVEICKALPIDKVDVVFYINPSATIPEVGMCGYAHGSHVVFISRDPDNSSLASSFGEELLATLAHEFHHCMRARGPGYGKNLLEALITEGLARDFENRFRTGKPPTYHGALSQVQIGDLLQRAHSEFSNPNYNHSEWFFGSEKRSIPKFAGYVLGCHLVCAYLVRNGRTSAELWDAPAEWFADSALTEGH